jgi:NAD(P)H-nitrite reductase large subunit
MGAVGSGHDSDLEGLSRGDSQIWGELGEAVMVESNSGDAHVRLALGDRTIAGAVVMRDQALSFPLQELIAARADISAIVAALQAPEAPVAELVQGLWRDWKAQQLV